ncbi:MAG: S41 family peptidase [Chitinophagales bacterium]|nr:S41 family peptidase [Chitinophagales bacterium]
MEANQFLKNILLIAIGILLGFLFIRTTLPNTKSQNKFDELLEIINKNYVDSIDYNAIESKAVNHLLNSLDPHSVYISREDIQAANEPLVGSFSGIGVEFYIVQDTIIVVSPISGGPSEMAGIKSGDKIVKINDTNVAGVKITNLDVFKKLRGVKGSSVKLTIQRNNSLLPAIVLKRDDIKVNSVEQGILIDSLTGFIKINSFGENTYDEFYTQLDELNKKKIQNLVIDLRQNTGGFLEIAVRILDELIPNKELLVYTNGLKYKREDFYSGKPGIFEKGKVAVLIDEGSASASEILAGAIQDLDRGIVIGRRSFGKGLVQNQIELSDGSAVRLTVAKYFTPSGRNIQKPYKQIENYEEEVYERYKNGEFFHEKNQITTDTITYLTKKGRKMKGGGGISPDIFVPLDTNYDFNSLAALRSYVPDFVYSNYERLSREFQGYKTILDFQKNYQLSTSVLSEFYIYAKKNGAKWNETTKLSYEAKLKNQLKAFIAKQYFKNEGYQNIINESDPIILRTRQYFNTSK